MIDPMGMQGFDSAELAEQDARATLYGIPFAIVKHGSYAWIAPLDCADRVIASNDLTLIKIIRD